MEDDTNLVLGTSSISFETGSARYFIVVDMRKTRYLTVLACSNQVPK